MDSPKPSYLIVGAGVFGASTALHIVSSEPSASVVLVDRTPFPCPYAASHDINKIVRADYTDIFYTNLALEAKDQWYKHSLYQPYYSEAGLLNARDKEYCNKVIKNYDDLAVAHHARILTIDEVKSEFNDLFVDTDWTGVERILWNPQSGIAEASDALTATIAEAVQRGVFYVEGTAVSLQFDDNQRCNGVRLDGDRDLSADHVILSTGAQTATLLANSAPHWNELQANGRLVAAGVVEAAVKLTADQEQEFRAAPAFCHESDLTLGETMPPTKAGLLKFCRDVSFTHKVYHAASDQTISVPPDSPGLSTWGQDVPSGLKKEVARVMKQIYGKETDGFEFDSYRLCWDAITPSQDWIISPHPASGNLYVATGGSFHWWKFLPILGKYVLRMLKGALNEEQVRRWSWDRDQRDGGAHEALMPKRDLKDIEGFLGKSQNEMPGTSTE